MRRNLGIDKYRFSTRNFLREFVRTVREVAKGRLFEADQWIIIV